MWDRSGHPHDGETWSVNLWKNTCRGYKTRSGDFGHVQGVVNEWGGWRGV